MFFLAGGQEEVKVEENPFLQLRISLNDVTLEEINLGDKNTKYSGNSIEIVKGDEIFEFDNLEIKGRGNSTWGGTKKKPYQIKFENKVNFGLGKGKKWILLADIYDPSHLRNDTAFYLAGMLDMEYSVSGEYAKLYIDDEYLGLYYLAQKIEIDKGRVDLKDPFGVIMELDNLHGGDKGCYMSYSNNCMTISDSVNKDNEDAAAKMFVEDFSALERAVKAKNYKKVLELADVESFAKYYLVSEFSVNPDSYSTSYHFYKDGEDDKIHAGPAWDYDFSFGNRKWIWQYNDDIYSPISMNEMKKYALGGDIYDYREGKVIKKSPNYSISKIIFDLLEIPEFKYLVGQIFRESLSGRKNELISHMNEQKDYIFDVASEDNMIWEADDFSQSADELINWVDTRYEFFEDEIGGREELLELQLEY